MEFTAAIICGLRTKDLVKNIVPGQVVVIDHLDLDHLAAESLIQAGVIAVINTSPSLSARYPNTGPSILEEAKIPLFDVTDLNLYEIEKYTHVSWNDTSEKLVFSGVGIEEVTNSSRWTRKKIEVAMVQARKNIGSELKHFAANTLEYIEKESEEFFAPIAVPQLNTKMKNRHCLVVVRGPHCLNDLHALIPYITENHPVIIAVDGGADMLSKVGLKSDIIIGDFDSVSSTELYGPELVLHVHRDGRAPGKEVLDAFGHDYVMFEANGTSEDVAMLMAYEAGADLIVAVGTHRTMVELLDKGRKGMASTLLTRMRLGNLLIDAQGVSLLLGSLSRNINKPETEIVTIAPRDIGRFSPGF